MSSTSVPVVPISFVDSVAAVSDLVDTIAKLKSSGNTQQPFLYVDLEGINLCRHGTVSLVTLLVDSSSSSSSSIESTSAQKGPSTSKPPHAVNRRRVYIIDVHTLGAQAFHTPGKETAAAAGTENGITLKQILEDADIIKVFFDVRNDSDALYAHFQVMLQGVEDVQLMELASRRFGRSREFIMGLAKCVAYDSAVDYQTMRRWREIKADGERLFKPPPSTNRSLSASDDGSSYQIFNQRPLPQKMIDYCAGDVVLLPRLRQVYWSQLSPSWKAMVVMESKNRVHESQQPGYVPQGREKAISPWGNLSTQGMETTVRNQWKPSHPLYKEL